MKALIASVVLATTAALAGGDPGIVKKLPCDGITTQVAPGVKVQCGKCEAKTDCPNPCPSAADCVCNPAPSVVLPAPLPVKEIVKVSELIQPKPFWFVPISAMYFGRDTDTIACGGKKCPYEAACPQTDGLGGAVGLGYQWPSRVSLSGQAAYQEGWGGVVTVTIPLGD